MNVMTRNVRYIISSNLKGKSDSAQIGNRKGLIRIRLQLSAKFITSLDSFIHNTSKKPPLERYHPVKIFIAQDLPNLNP